MAKCCRCQAETELFVNGLPICIKCSAEFESTQQNQAGIRAKLISLMNFLVYGIAPRVEVSR
jgi:hypothetical protein